jgi:plasmid maintenance system antidote protein VapI
MKYELIRRGLSTITVAVVCGMQQPKVSAVANGRLKPTPSQRIRLASVLGLSPDLLLEPVELSTDTTAALVKVGRAYLRVKELEAEAAG